MSHLADYIHHFSTLRQDQNENYYPTSTKHASPHKPLLLLAVLDRFAEGSISDNQIPLDPGLGDLFSDYWRQIMPADRHPNIALPFYHLTSEGFWHLIPSDGSENVVESGRRLRSTHLLHEHTEGAQLDDELFGFLQEDDSREALRRTLIEEYFDDAVQHELYDIGRVHEETYRYSRALLEHVRSKGGVDVDEPDEPSRNQGFRRAVVEAYDHRCAISGIRILTADGLTAVDAAHIVPWSESHNDDPRNGLALSKLCHWIFEQGLLTIEDDHTVRLSPQITASYNTPGHLATLEGRSILLPDKEALWPDPEYLAHHRENRFRN